MAPFMTIDPPKVAVIEDDPSVRKALLRLLRSAGFTAEGFSSAEHFLRLRRRHHCLVLDVRLPGMSGIELHRALACGRNSPPVIFISGHTTRESVEIALPGQGVEFLDKPFDETLLLAAIRRALQRAGNATTAHDRPAWRAP